MVNANYALTISSNSAAPTCSSLIVDVEEDTDINRVRCLLSADKLSSSGRITSKTVETRNKRGLWKSKMVNTGQTK